MIVATISVRAARPAHWEVVVARDEDDLMRRLLLRPGLHCRRLLPPPPPESGTIDVHVDTRDFGDDSPQTEPYIPVRKDRHAPAR